MSILFAGFHSQERITINEKGNKVWICVPSQFVRIMTCQAIDDTLMKYPWMHNQFKILLKFIKSKDKVKLLLVLPAEFASMIKLLCFYTFAYSHKVSDGYGRSVSFANTLTYFTIFQSVLVVLSFAWFRFSDFQFCQFFF